ncbi:MAG TPA: phage portal protein, partial [Fervidobacterium sp.]|nr:phage portal protein [Fervidobacterium sp.]
ELTTNRAINLDDLNIEITVNLPTNEAETINNLLMMLTGGLMTKETALKKVPYIDNPDEELAKLIENSPDVYRLNEGVDNGNATTD